MPKILIIDDSRFARLQLSNNLKAAGFEVVEAANGQEGLDAIEAESPTAIICDLLMPVMDGLQFLQAVREQGIEIPVLVITSDIQAKTHERVMELGAVGLINKPPKYAEVIGKLQTLTGEH